MGLMDSDSCSECQSGTHRICIGGIGVHCVLCSRAEDEARAFSAEIEAARACFHTLLLKMDLVDADDEPELTDQDAWTLPHEVPRVWSRRPSLMTVWRWMTLAADAWARRQ